MPNFVVLGCLEVGEKFRVVGWWGHFHSKNHVTPTLGQVRLQLGWAVTTDPGPHKAVNDEVDGAVNGDQEVVSLRQRMILMTKMLKQKNYQRN